MNKSVIISLILLMSLITLSAAPCDLDVSLINQDPYPGIPGDYVKVVFQIDGIENPVCGLVTFEVKENYPFSLDPSSTNQISLTAGTYSRTYSSFYLATYKLRVDSDAIDGDNPIEVVYTSEGTEFLKEFNINIEDTKADFEVNIKDYDYATKELTFEILNIEEADVEALTIEIPKQDNIQIKGANRKVIGDLDSNEYTSAEFEAIPQDGEITLNIIYTDSINVRRTIEKTVTFDSSYFTDRNGDKKSGGWIFYVIIIGIAAWIIWKKVKKAKMKKKLQHKH